MGKQNNRKENSSYRSSADPLDKEKEFIESHYITQREFNEYKKENENRINKFIAEMNKVSESQKRSTSHLDSIFDKILVVEGLLNTFNFSSTLFSKKEKSSKNRIFSSIVFSLALVGLLFILSAIIFVLYLMGKC